MSNESKILSLSDTERAKLGYVQFRQSYYQDRVDASEPSVRASFGSAGAASGYISGHKVCCAGGAVNVTAARVAQPAEVTRLH